MQRQKIGHKKQQYLTTECGHLSIKEQMIHIYINMKNPPYLPRELISEQIKKSMQNQRPKLYS